MANQSKNEKCACKGMKLFSKLIDLNLEALHLNEFGDDIKERSTQAGQDMFDHLLIQANAPENEFLRDEAMKRLEKSRNKMSDYRCDNMGVMIIDEVRDAIHKTPALRKLLFCNNAPEQSDAVETIINILADYPGDPTVQVKARVNQMSKKLGCPPDYSTFL